MKSRSSREPLNLERDLPTTPDDAAALRHLQAGALIRLKDYLDFLAQFPAPATGQLRVRKGPNGTPFSLVRP